MKSSTIKKIVLFFTIITFTASIIIFRTQIKNLYKSVAATNITEKIWFKPKEHHITIFTHGAFGSLLGFLNTNDVIKDNIQGTKYKKLISKMRKNPYFYKCQPILQKGLVKIEPSFNLSISKNKQYAAYPVIKAYETISNLITKNKHTNSFYTFGWSGLMSQKRRRLEAIRFYNALSEEINNYKEKGINPIIKIIAHSHGGNLCLNLAAVEKSLQCINNLSTIENIPDNADEKESLTQMILILKGLPQKENVQILKGQKAFDYIPEHSNLKISKLILLGTPIQPETECFIAYDIFNKVYSFYSNKDYVQECDWVSTKRPYSNQRLNLLEKIKKNKIVQIKIMMNRKVSIKKNKTINGITDETFTLTTKNVITTQGVWNKLLDKITSFWTTKAITDPSHRELWFPNWEKRDAISPLPMVIFTPLMVNAVNKISQQTNDLDLNISFTGNKLTFYVLKHDDMVIQDKVSIYKKIIERIKSKIKKWKPEDLHLKKEFDIISKYSNNL